MYKKIFVALLAWGSISAPLYADAVAPEVTAPVDSLSALTDSVTVYPESFEEDVHNLFSDWYMRQYAVVDEKCQEESVNVDYPDSVYIRRLSQIPSVIELPYNRIVRQYIDMYVQKRRPMVSRMLGLSAYYMPIFEEALERENMPLELKYLPVIESALQPKATSRMGAAGLWQFMVGTGKHLGMEINSLVDERRDPIVSSAMAARFLKDLYRIYHDWTLVIAAYNCGPGNVNKAIRRSGGKTDYWEIYRYLPRETRGYVPAFIAANYVMHYYEEHNICPALTVRPLITDTIMISKRLYFKQISDILNIPEEEISSLNPQYRAGVIPGNIKPYSLTLPSQQVYAFLESQDTIFSHRSQYYAHRERVEPAGYSNDLSYHRVRKGEALSTIARKYGVSVNNLKRWNGLRNNNIRAGQRLAVYYGGKSAPKEVKTDKKRSGQSVSQQETYKNFLTHRVADGESLWSISQKYKGVSVEAIKRANQLRSNTIRPGQTLRIPQQ